MLASLFDRVKLHTEQMSEASLRLSGVAICLSPMPTNQLLQLGLETECKRRTVTANRRSEKERWRKKKL